MAWLRAGRQKGGMCIDESRVGACMIWRCVHDMAVRVRMIWRRQCARATERACGCCARMRLCAWLHTCRFHFRMAMATR
jgi:hypothetical protein